MTNIHVMSSISVLVFLQTEGVTKNLASRDDFVLFLFTLMTNKKTFLQTATLIEDILGVKKVSLKCIERIKNICLIYKNKHLTINSDKRVEYVTTNI